MDQRVQDRGIPRLIVDWLEGYGDHHHDNRGAIIFYFTKRARRNLEKEVGSAPIRRMHEWMDSYLVKSNDGVGITVGKRFARLKR